MMLKHKNTITCRKKIHGCPPFNSLMPPPPPAIMIDTVLFLLKPGAFIEAQGLREGFIPQLGLNEMWRFRVQDRLAGLQEAKILSSENWCSYLAFYCTRSKAHVVIF